MKIALWASGIFAALALQMETNLSRDLQAQRERAETAERERDEARLAERTTAERLMTEAADAIEKRYEEYGRLDSHHSIATLVRRRLTLWIEELGILGILPALPSAKKQD